MARPLDRLAAFIVDVVFLYPIMALIQSPWLGKLKTQSLAGNFDSLADLQVLMSFIAILVFVFYHGACHYFFNKTLGKKLLSLEVHWESKTLSKCFLRPVIIFFEVLLFLIPLLALFSHFRRRILHDRICDSFVFSKIRSSQTPNSLEIAFSRFGSIVLLGLGLFLGLSSIFPAPEGLSVADLQIETDASCELYTEIYDGAMSTALEAFALKQIDESCLQTLSQVHAWEDSDPVLSYIGMALAHREVDLKKSLSYQKEICASSQYNLECQFLSWVFSEEEVLPKEESLLREMASSSYQPNFFNVFLVDSLLSADNNQQAHDLLGGVSVTEQNRDFLKTASVYNLLRMGKWDSAFWVYQTSGLDEDVLLDFFKDAVSEKKHSKLELKGLLERFYPKLNQNESRRFPASEKNIPSKVQVLWQNLGG